MSRRAILSIFLLLCGAASADAATIRGRLVNGTTNEPGQAESIRLIDMASGMDQIGLLEDVTGDFVFEDIPATEGSPYVVQLQSGDVLYSQPVPMTGDSADVEFTVFESTDDLSAVQIGIYHVIFQRQHEVIDVIELFEFENGTEPPMAVWRDQGPITVELPTTLVGEVECSVTAASSRMPLNQELLETDEDDIYTIPYALKPGVTRVVMRYQVSYEGEVLDWAPTMFHPVVRRSILISPDDIEVTAADLRPATEEHPPPPGYAAYLGEELAANQTFAFRLEGGSEVAVDPHAGMNTESDDGHGGDSTIEIQPNRLSEARGFVLLGLTGLLLIAFVLMLDRSSAGHGITEAAERLGRLEDGYVSGSIDRRTFEDQRRRILGLSDPSPSAPEEPAPSRKA